MKKLIWAFFAAVALITVACNKEYDDSALKKKVNDLEARVTALEALNTTVSGISDIVTALSEKDYVTGVINVKNSDGEVIGYTITFSKSSPVTIYNGLKGDKGDVGPEGPEGPVGPLPSIGVQLGEDGVYYWVVEGEVIKDSEGNPIPCTQVAPSFKIEEGAWWVSYDGQNWTKLGLISDTGTTVEVDNSNEDYVLLTINGTEVQIPKEKPFTLDIKYDGDLGAELPVDGRKFETDYPAAYDAEASRHFGELQHCGRIKRTPGSGDRQAGAYGACGDYYGVAVVTLAVHFYGGAAAEPRSPLHQSNQLVPHKGCYARLQLGDNSAFALMVGGIHSTEGLCGDAALVQAGAAEGTFAHQYNFDSAGSSFRRSLITAGAGADDNDSHDIGSTSIIILSRPLLSLAAARSMISCLSR